MVEKRIDSVKKEIRSVLISSKGGVSLQDFCKTYRNLIGARLPTREFGFTSDIDFLYSLPDVVHIQVERSGSYQLYGIADEATKHIQKLVNKQKQSKINPQKLKEHSKITRRYQNFVPLVTQYCRPFVPALLRSEIIEIVKHYPDGISYLSLIRAYQNFYEKEINLEWLSSNPDERFKKLADAVPELDLKLIHNQLKIHYLNLHENKDSSASNDRPQSSKAKVSPKFSDSNSRKSVEVERKQEVLALSSIPKDVMSNFVKVLTQYPNGILDVHFPILYEKLTKIPLDLHDLGFSSLLELVDALPDIFYCENVSESSKNWILLPADFSKQTFQPTGLKSKTHAHNLHSQKFSAYNFKQNTPSDIASPSLPYVQKELPDATERFIPVFVSSIINPNLFWIQLQTEEAVANFEKLEKEMRYFYANQDDTYKMADADILIGSSCVAFSTVDFDWYRALIISLPSVDYVNVSFVDYGSCGRIHRSNLYYLKYTLFKFPAHAHKSRLASIKPVNQLWNMEAQTRFLQLCNQVSLMAKIDSLDDGIISLFLCDTSEDENIYINDVLVNEGFAEICVSDNLYSNCSSNSENLCLENGVEGSSNYNYQEKTFPEVKRVSDPGTSNGLCFSNGKEKHTFQPKRLFEKLEELKFSSNKRRYVKQILISDEYKINIIKVAEAAYVSGEDLCNLLWSDKDADVLALRLQFKDAIIPTVTISQKDFEELFSQCKRYSVRGFYDAGKESSVVLYPLKYVIKVLNIFGHPSVSVREAICKELTNFDAQDVFWNNFQEPEENETVQSAKHNLSKLCLYDLKALHEGLRFKRLKLLRDAQGNINSTEINKIELIQSSLMEQMDAINSICLQYKC